MSIQLLPPLVVNKIAAGEVVERPASVVKELLENAIDSGASRIDVTLEKGGSELVRITDNGKGIRADELPLAVTNHATSKITSAEELFEVGTLGFRGEALASIASVSRLLIRSKPEGEEGAELRVNGGHEEPIVPAGCPRGTTVEVRDLFYNTPVRQKFLRTPQTEAAHATESFTRVALAHPGVHFTLTHNGRLLHDLPALPEGTELNEAWRERIGALFGDELAEKLIAVSSLDEREDGTSVSLEGFVAPPTESRSHAKMQYLLLNGRAIRDRALQHALGEAYRGLLLTGRKPICFLRLTMPPALVDVNVHPMKLEVRFTEGGPLYSQLLGTLRSKFLSTDLRSGAATEESEAIAPPSSDQDEVRSAADDSSSLVDWAKRGIKQRRFDEPDASTPRFYSTGGNAPFKPYPDQAGSREPLTLHRIPEGAQSWAARQTRTDHPTASQSDTAQADQPTTAQTTTPPEPSSGFKAMQLHNRYLIVETEAGMEVIDQHALHERVLYEQLRRRALSGPIETQRLLVPEPVDLAPSEAAAVLESQELLAKLGLEVEPFGGDTVLVASVPALLRVANPAEMIREVAAQLVAGGKEPEARDLCDELLHMMSCKAAVKYGDPLTDEEIDALLAARPMTENHHHCPHGRPTSLLFSREELDHRFERV